ncbi:hypothetical protein SAY86_018795 [Trapa natans]|uniref:Uncharacterized protein n=1 Tax=Trapa natans TaxID=22666 RepID=A0AAN7QZ61_TRANT|nr:hypothetical protein SAY86_018795 [Trapa natans]
MDPYFQDPSCSIDGFHYGCHIPSLDSSQSSSIGNRFKSNEPVPLPIPVHSLGVPDLSVVNGEKLVFPAEHDGESFDPSMSLHTNSIAGRKAPPSSDASGSSDPLLKYISQMLMEENLEEEFWANPDYLALTNTERSLYNALELQYPGLPEEFQSQFAWSPNVSLPTSITSVNRLLDRTPMSNCKGCGNALKESCIQGKTSFDDDYSVTQFMKGFEEATKFLPSSNQSLTNPEDVNSSCSWHKDVGIRSMEGTLDRSRGRKSRLRKDIGLLEARLTKQIATYVEADESELSDMFDKVLLCTEKAEPPSPSSSCLLRDADRNLQSWASLGGLRKDTDTTVDLRALLVQCAQTLTSDDLMTANRLLKQIRGKSSPSGNGSQRLAHYFANGLEVRMAGSHSTNEDIFTSAASKKILVADMLKAYQLFLSYCPFLRLSILYMNYMTFKVARKAPVLHIIVFGIGFGFHLPSLIQMLAEQPGGPPKLRITGIEFPCPGFCPERIIEGTGRRLARYCQRFDVPFEFVILPSRSWDAIKVEDLRIEAGEVVAVNCATRSHNFLDESFSGVECPRDALLDLIRRIKPHIFLHMVSNGSYNAPFFIRRFRETLFHMSSIYDMLDTTIPDEHKNSKERQLLESELYGWGIMNAIACEGLERIERPETYKQWQVRHERAGFKQLPLDRAKMKEIRRKLKTWYHEDYLLDEDSNWILLGWKGRILYATACWVPV